MPNAVAQAAALLMQKETTYGTAVTSAMTAIPFEAWTPQEKNLPINRPTTRKRAGQSYPATGGLEIAASFRPAPEPDALFPCFAGLFGSQTTPALTIAVATSLLTGNTTAGAGTVIGVTPGTGSSFVVGQNVTVGVGSANVEVCVISAVSANSVTATTTKTHSTGDTITEYSALAYSSTFSFALSTLPSYTFEYNRVLDAVDYTGMKFADAKFSIAPNGSLTCDFSLVGQNVAVNASPVTPAFGTLSPIIAEAGGGLTVNGVALGSGTLLKKFDLSLSNNLDKSFRTVSSRLIQDAPLGQRTGSLSIMLSWPDTTKYALFLGAVGATTQQNTIASVALTLTLNSGSYVDATNKIPYAMTFVLPALFPTSDAVPGKLAGAIEQTFSCNLAETAGQNNDLQISIVGASSTVY